MKKIITLLAFLICTISILGQITYDGNISEGEWGTALATSAGGPAPGFGAGHEINAVYSYRNGNNINFAIAGNVQSGNRILMFIDSKPGGYNTANFDRTNAPEGIDDFNSGTTFDSSFEPDYCLVIGTVGANYFFDLFTLAATGSNNFLGDSDGTPTIGAAPANSSNTAGFEIQISKSDLGYSDGNSFKVFLAYTSDGGFLSNQFLTVAGAGDGNYGSGSVTFGAATPNPITISPTSLYSQNVKVLDLRSVSHSFNISDNASNALDLGNDYTIETWLYVEPQTIGSSQRIMYYSGSWDMQILDGSTPGSNFKVRVLITGGGSFTSNDINMDEWHHISFTSDNATSRTRLHVDGASQASGLTPTSLNAASTLGIGATTFSSTYLNGAIDQIRISNTDRYPFAFTINKDDALFTDDANTVLLLHFDDSSVPPTNYSLNQSFTITNNGIAGTDYKDFDDASFSETLPLPVELTSFTALPQGEFVNLTWETATEVNNYGFEIERSVVGTTHELSLQWDKVGFVEGHGNSNSIKQYSFTDNTVIAGQAYSYRLKQIDFDGKFEYSSIVNVEAGIPTVFNLEQNYPNPFNPTTSISFSLPKAAQVNLSVYNVLGEKVAQLINTQMEAGKHTINFNASNLSTGTYIYRIETPEFSTSKKMMLVK